MHKIELPTKEKSQNYRGLKSLLHFLFTFIAGTKRRSEFSRARSETELTTTFGLRTIQRNMAKRAEVFPFENSFIPREWLAATLTLSCMSFWGSECEGKQFYVQKFPFLPQFSGVSRGRRSQKQEEEFFPRSCAEGKFVKLPEGLIEAKLIRMCLIKWKISFKV